MLKKFYPTHLPLQTPGFTDQMRTKRFLETKETIQGVEYEFEDYCSGPEHPPPDYVRVLFHWARTT
jgi:hypothetical protein